MHCVHLPWFLQIVAEAAAGPSQDQEAHQASVQELQGLRDSLAQAETRTRDLEEQLENLNTVRNPSCRPFDIYFIYCLRS